MQLKLFLVRHCESYDNEKKIFSGWRDSALTNNGMLEARKIAKKLYNKKIDYAFTSHLKRAKHTLKLIIENHPQMPIFVDDRIIERCYGGFQGRKKQFIKKKLGPIYFSIHRGYDYIPPDGESLFMVEKRVLTFFAELKNWLVFNPGNVLIVCHNNSIRPLRRILENLTLSQMLQIETPQDRPLIYDIKISIHHQPHKPKNLAWKGITLPPNVKFASNILNPLKKFY